MAIPDDKNYLKHYGTPRHSGRYPWGSGKNPQRNKSFLQREAELKAQGLTEKERANAFGISTADLRARHSIATNAVKMDQIAEVVKLRDKGYSLSAISDKTGIPQSTVKTYLDPTKEARVNKTITIADNLESMLKEKPYLDVGEGVERQLNISDVQLNTALSVLKERGLTVKSIQVAQATNPLQKTTVRVLAPEGTTTKDIYDHMAQITSPDGLYFDDYGSEAVKRKPVPSIKSDRVMVRYTEDGGSEKDGVIEIRPGVEDLNLGGRTYAQVRIAVDGTHYLKGMAVYGYNMPDGVDIVFNTNKHKGTPMTGDEDNTVLKPVKNDPSNPFGSAFTQWSYTNAKGEKIISPVNIVNDDDSWDKWQKSLSSQFLSKQPLSLAKRQLDLDAMAREQELKEITSIPNPTLKRQLLETFASECDSAAVHLKGAALPRQGTFAILPVSSLKDNEVFAPKYENGEEVVLVRFPHAGTFEMPRLKVNNRNKEALSVITNESQHAIGINYKVAEQLSGADYDGDTVLVIPTKGQNIRSTARLEQLKDFDPKELYKNPPEAKKTGSKGEGFNKGKEMGMVSNLITDMTIKGASPDEIARAVKHSMVVIDAQKHNLDWRKSELDNNISELRLKYQGKEKGGASTLISKRKSIDTDVYERKELKGTSQMTEEELRAWNEGKRVFRDTGRTYRKHKEITDVSEMTEAELERHNAGKKVYREYGRDIPEPSKETAYKILEVNDAREMSSGYPIENIYADYANRVKHLANEARKELRITGRLKKDPEAAKLYKEELDSLDNKLNLAALNAPKERQAQLIARKNIEAIKQTDPSLTLKEYKDKLMKVSSKELAYARDRVGAKRHPIDITEREWAAIQAGAVSDTKLTAILRYTDTAKIRQLATPHKSKGMPASTKSRARALLRSGYTQAEVAEAIGVSVKTLAEELKGFEGIGGE